MEAMDICIATAKDISYLIINHPIYSAFGSFIILASLLKFYCRLTSGVCECDQDMAGKTILITGASAGIGKATARELARRRARVLLACRNVAKAEKVAGEIRRETGNENVVVKCLDLCSFASVRECAEDVLRTEDRLDGLINNAGIADLGTSPIQFTEDGHEKIMQSNHLGHFLLTLLLLDLLKGSAPSRIINVASRAKNFAQLDVEDLTKKKDDNNFSAYGNSKFANVLFTTELSHRLLGTGVTVNALCPGCVSTDIFGDKSIFSSPLMFFTKMLFLFVAKTPDEGAQTTIYLAVDPELKKTTGKFFRDCKEEKLRKEDTDRTVSKRLFEISEQIVGVSFTQKGEKTE